MIDPRRKQHGCIYRFRSSHGLHNFLPRRCLRTQTNNCGDDPPSHLGCIRGYQQHHTTSSQSLLSPFLLFDAPINASSVQSCFYMLCGRQLFQRRTKTPIMSTFPYGLPSIDARNIRRRQSTLICSMATRQQQVIANWFLNQTSCYLALESRRHTLHHHAPKTPLTDRDLHFQTHPFPLIFIPWLLPSTTDLHPPLPSG